MTEDKRNGLNQQPTDNFLQALSSPARNAFLHAGIDTPQKLAAHSEKEILELHGVGPASLPVLRSILKQAELTFRP